jgi:hypothetical protein
MNNSRLRSVWQRPAPLMPEHRFEREKNLAHLPIVAADPQDAT